MKRTLSLLLIITLLMPIVAFAAVPDVNPLTDDELLNLYTRVKEELRERGKYPYVELKKGSSGDEVISLQNRLKELGYYAGEVDGKYGNNTVNALKQFQKAFGNKQTGVASVELQALLYSEAATSVPSPPPKPTKKPTPTPDPRKAYKTIEYKKVARDPDAYKGTKAKIKGKVVQVLGDKNKGFELRVATRRSYDDIYYIITAGNHPKNILENDNITFYCTLAGDLTYETILGSSITLPLANADFFELTKK
jgi:peptidoglycan hydrolase-like protein with peptidoglycan-binding domain